MATAALTPRDPIAVHAAAMEHTRLQRIRNDNAAKMALIRQQAAALPMEARSTIATMLIVQLNAADRYAAIRGILALDEGCDAYPAVAEDLAALESEAVDDELREHDPDAWRRSRRAEA